jgi:hypothetical protein
LTLPSLCLVPFSVFIKLLWQGAAHDPYILSQLWSKGPRLFFQLSIA